MPEPLVDRIVRSQRWLDPLGDASQGAIGWVFKLLGSPGHAGSKACCTAPFRTICLVRVADFAPPGSYRRPRAAHARATR